MKKKRLFKVTIYTVGGIVILLGTFVIMALMPPNIQNPGKYIGTARWMNVWSKNMPPESIKYPAYGVNVFETSQENLECATKNIVYDQNVVAFDLFEGKVVFHETYEHCENIRTILIIRWKESPMGEKATKKALKAMEEKGIGTMESIVTVIEFFEMVKAYNWTITRELPDDPATYLDLFDIELY